MILHGLILYTLIIRSPKQVAAKTLLNFHGTSVPSTRGECFGVSSKDQLLSRYSMYPYKKQPSASCNSHGEVPFK